jgi:hypothetical protein
MPVIVYHTPISLSCIISYYFYYYVTYAYVIDLARSWHKRLALLMTIFFYLNTSQHNAVFLCLNKFMLLKNHYISHVVNFGAS